MPKKKAKKAKKPVSKHSSANLDKCREQTKQHLQTGRKPKTALTIRQLEYCAWRAQGAYMGDSARWAGIAPGNMYELEHRDLTQATIKEFQEQFKVDVVERTKRLGEDLAVFVHGEYRSRLRKMKTHHFRGDESIARLLKTGFEACGAIQPAKNINQANAAAAASSSTQIYAKRLYLPDWRREKIEQLQNDERRTSGVKVPPASAESGTASRSQLPAS
jgi:hypothetical protein